MKFFIAVVCVGLILATVVCEDEEKDLMRSLLLDGDVKAQTMNGFVYQNLDSYDCKAYCNGVQVDNLETPACDGVFWIGCNYMLKEVEGKSSSACIGSFKRTKTSDKADVYCDGAWHSHSWDTITIHGKDACSVSGYSCGGFLDVAYNLSPPSQETFSVEEQKINYTCQGTEGHMHAMSKEKAADVSIEDLSKVVDDYFLSEFGVEPDFMFDVEQMELDDDEEQDFNDYRNHHNFNCTATCGGDNVDPMAPQFCLTEFDESCSCSCHNHTMKFSQSCKGAYTGYPESSGEACLGKYTWDFTGERGSCKGYCTKAFANKWVERNMGVATFDTCYGESFATITYPREMSQLGAEQKKEAEVVLPVA